MKRTFFALLVVLMLVVSACAPAQAPAEEPAETPTETPVEEPMDESSQESDASSDSMEETGMYEDGIYYAEADEFSANSGWKSVVILKVTDGKISEVNWTAASKDGGMDKKAASMNGAYPMVEAGGAQAPWHEQAEKMEMGLLEMQDPSMGEYNDEGYTDAVSGVSIHVNDFYMLAEEALAAGPVEPGPYKDGGYHAEEPEFSENSGWKATVDITVLNGNIVAVNWSGQHKDGGEDKKTASMNGNYPMVENGGAKAPWHEQAMEAEDHLLMTQDPWDIELDAEGHADVLTSVSIHVDDFFLLAQEALESAK